MEIINKSSQTNVEAGKQSKESDILFAPIAINQMIVPNRIVMPAMHLNMTESSYIGDRITAFYAARARGGAGALIAGYAGVNESAGGWALSALTEMNSSKDYRIYAKRCSRAEEKRGCS